MNKYVEDFLAWYDTLPSRKQAEVDDLADDMGLPLYEDCTEGELSTLRDSIVSNPIESGCSVEASDDRVNHDDADLYIVKIWYEVDPGHDVAYPQAAEEIIAVFANSPQQAKEWALDQWDGPVDRIEIVDINPEGYEPDEELPFEACSDITASSNAEDGMRADLFKDYSDPDTMEYEALLNIDWTDVTAEDSEVLVSQGLPKKPAQVKSVSYWKPDEESGYDGGYVVEYKDGNYVIWAFENGSEELYCYEQGTIEGSTDIADESNTEQSIEGSSNYNNSYIRGILADYLDNGTFTKKQYDDALNVRFDIGGDDVALLAEGGYLDDTSKLVSVRYVTDKTMGKINDKYDTQYDGGYIFRYNDGSVEWYGFFEGDNDIYFVMSNK